MMPTTERAGRADWSAEDILGPMSYEYLRRMKGSGRARDARGLYQYQRSHKDDKRSTTSDTTDTYLYLP